MVNSLTFISDEVCHWTLTSPDEYSALRFMMSVEARRNAGRNKTMTAAMSEILIFDSAIFISPIYK
jgi:hypothetical protein